MSTPNGPSDAHWADSVDEEAAAIAAERIRSGAADGTEDGAEALETLGVSFHADGILGRLGHEPATLAEFEAVYGRVRASDDDG
jgi:hypothetical protein